MVAAAAETPAVRRQQAGIHISGRQWQDQRLLRAGGDGWAAQGDWREEEMREECSPLWQERVSSHRRLTYGRAVSRLLTSCGPSPA